MKRALVLLADGCEELEAVSIVDVLRRGGAETAALSIAGRTEIAGAHGIRILADGLFDPAAAASADAIALPGGMGGMRALRASPAPAAGSSWSVTAFSASCIAPMLTVRRRMPSASQTRWLSEMSFCSPSGSITP